LRRLFVAGDLLATVVDVQVRTDMSLTTEQQERVAVLIADASALAWARVPDLPKPIAGHGGGRDLYRGLAGDGFAPGWQ
jgi:hypothetical protein